MFIITPEGWLDPDNPHFECPDYLKSLSCNHHFIKVQQCFEVSAERFFADMLGIFGNYPDGTPKDYLITIKKTENKCALCGLANTKYEHIF
jgi:hypothetical protein